MARIDLHSHSLHSDGSHTPTELVAMARKAGITALALTDHDTVAGLAELHAAAAEGGAALTVVDGVELSASAGMNDIHILGYFIDPRQAEFQIALKIFQEGRRNRVITMLEKLKALGVELTLGDVERHAGGGSLGRPHVALALLDAGYIDTFDEAFARYLGHRAPAFVGKPRFAPEEAIALIRAAGGVAVFAHPGTANRDDLIPRLKAAGLSGIEVWHPKHGPGQRAHYLRVAKDFDLVPSGGSDFHGARVGDVVIGMSDVPESTLADLAARR
ncbi:MAG TPA: PHP domain-containing protein [Candidatus Eisenbacteria bacterium]